MYPDTWYAIIYQKNDFFSYSFYSIEQKITGLLKAIITSSKFDPGFNQHTVSLY